jgi:hypothetical protein
MLSSAVSAQDAASDLLGRINGLRASLGLPGYTFNGTLAAAALNQAQYMANTGQISHTQSDGSTPSSRAAAAGYGGRWVSENIYAGSSARAVDAWNFWLNSPIHYRGMTNPNYQEIGIASATSSWGQAFVLVFGSTGGSTYVAPRSSSGSSSAAAASGPPPFVVGIDSFGNIMHEVQPEQTIGDILLIYGYTWEDLQDFLALNSKTQDDIRTLKIGEVVLVPPYDGTYTPTPLPEGWPTATPLQEEFVATAIAEAAALATEQAGQQPIAGASPSPSPTTEVASPVAAPSEAAQAIAASPTTQAIARIATAAGAPAFLLASPSPSPTLPIVPTAAAVRVAAVQPTVAPLEDIIAPTPTQPVNWLWVAIGVQAVVIAGAGVQYFRKRGK